MRFWVLTLTFAFVLAVPARAAESSAWYLVQQLDVDGAFVVGLDYLHWTTEYDSLDEGTDNRINLYLTYLF